MECYNRDRWRLLDSTLKEVQGRYKLNHCICICIDQVKLGILGSCITYNEGQKLAE